MFKQTSITTSFIENIKNSKNKFFYFLLILTVSILCLDFFHSFKIYNFNQTSKYLPLPNLEWYHFISFSKYSLLTILSLFFIILKENKNNKKYKITNFIALCSLINILINTFCFRSFIRDLNIYPSNIKYFNLIIYYLEFLLLPSIFLFFYFSNKFKVSWKMIIPILLNFIFYLIINFILNLIYYYISIATFLKEQLINYDNKIETYFLIPYIQIIISFAYLTSIIICFQKMKKYFFLKVFVLILTMLSLSIITFNYKEWKHATSLFSESNSGSGIFPETQEMSQYFTNISNLKKSELKEKGYKILELGAGTGNVTKYLIEKFGVENIICIEWHWHLCDFLRKEYPGLTVIQGNAAVFINLLEKNGLSKNKIKGIVSTLPISIFEKTDFINFENNINEIIKENKIKFMNYRFKFFETKERQINIKPKEDLIFITSFIPVSIYTFEGTDPE
ncbi:hypothetical protein CWO85_01150 [Candidatus Phytoplasma ziziphi]|uniref:Dimethyladenosine transferase n=1 Tax=Ziziphus jujuba witches'-broom phytoplasma TaxID=135727 RepID=A0A660HM81_ZIZJU|nr:rRNA adenine N-6-methyltransferase family protein [Candidatus Phytoplasma ziziphi]AYJ01140.1 hypothetical protein CWO85_01150 [Candidatus Phytoplasma ziziphi]